MRTTRMTTKGKIVALLVVILIAIATLKFTGNFPSFSGNSIIPSVGSSGGSYKGGDVINLSLDEWIGWKSFLDANGGLETQPGSVYDKLGLKVKFNVINDATQSSNALIKGELAGAGYTVNRYTFLYPKFINADVPTVMPYVTNFSSGGDGIIAKVGINSINDLVGKKIAVPRYSEAQTLVMWLLGQSSLSDSQKQQVIKDIVYFDTPDDAAKAFFGGKVDAAATWQPYLSQAASDGSGQILFSTKDAHNIILDGMVFRKDYYDANKETVAKLIKGSLQAQEMYTKDLNAIKQFPLFATMTDADIKATLPDATLASYADNKKLLDGTAQLLFTDMSNVWKQLGETAMSEKAAAAFDISAIDSLSSEFSSIATAAPTFSAEQKAVATNSAALLTKTCTIEFNSNTATFKDPDAAAAILDEFAGAAKIMDGTIIQVEGNIADVGGTGTASAGGQQLSQLRAQAVANYMARYQSIDVNRFIVIGNGVSKQIAPNDTEANQRMNRRTDISFKTVE